MSDERCDLTKLLASQCGCPKHRGGAEVTRLADDPGYVHAGRCPR